MSGWTLLFSGVPAAIYLPFTEFGDTLTGNPNGPLSFLYIAILAAIGTSLALVMFTKLIMMTEPVIASAVAYLIPVVAMLWGFADGEEIKFLDIAGLAVIFIGLYLVSDYRRSRSKLSTS